MGGNRRPIPGHPRRPRRLPAPPGRGLAASVDLAASAVTRGRGQGNEGVGYRSKGHYRYRGLDIGNPFLIQCVLVVSAAS